MSDIIKEQFAELSKTSAARAAKVAAIAIANAEKIAKLNFDAAKTVLARNIQGAEAVTSIKDASEYVTLRTKFNEAAVEGVVGYSRSLYDVATEAQSQYAQVAEEAWASYTKGAAGWVDTAGKTPFVTPVKTRKAA